MSIVPWKRDQAEAPEDIEAGIRDVLANVKRTEAVDAYAPKPKLTDIQFAAGGLDNLRHRDMADMCKAVWGEKAPESAAELADRIAAWAETARAA